MGGISVREIVFVCFAIGLTACGRAPTLEEQNTFHPYYHRFVAEAKKFNRRLSPTPIGIYFSQLTPSRLGLCEENWLQSPKIYIDQTAWRSLSEGGKEALIFHELGHCVLNRDHKDTKTWMLFPRGEQEVPESLMNTHGVTSGLYLSRRDYFLTELFTRT